MFIKKTPTRRPTQTHTCVQANDVETRTLPTLDEAQKDIAARKHCHTRGKHEDTCCTLEVRGERRALHLMWVWWTLLALTQPLRGGAATRAAHYRSTRLWDVRRRLPAPPWLHTAGGSSRVRGVITQFYAQLRSIFHRIVRAHSARWGSPPLRCDLTASARW